MKTVLVIALLALWLVMRRWRRLSCLPAVAGPPWVTGLLFGAAVGIYVWEERRGWIARHASLGRAVLAPLDPYETLLAETGAAAPAVAPIPRPQVAELRLAVG